MSPKKHSKMKQFAWDLGLLCLITFAMSVNTFVQLTGKRGKGEKNFHFFVGVRSSYGYLPQSDTFPAERSANANAELFGGVAD